MGLKEELWEKGDGWFVDRNEAYNNNNNNSNLKRLLHYVTSLETSISWVVDVKKDSAKAKTDLVNTSGRNT